MELTHYEAAERYLKDMMNSKTALPTKAWKEERDKLNAERLKLSYQYSTLKDQMKEVEQIRKNIYRIMREENMENSPHKSMALNYKSRAARSFHHPATLLSFKLNLTANSNFPTTKLKPKQKLKHHILHV